jgi:flagellar biogenesis protein FliO
MFPIQSGVKQGGSLPLLLFILALEYVIRRLQANQEGLNLSGAHQLLVYADVTILSESIHTIKKNTKTLFVAGKRIGLK